jgi:hypothetical protein
MIIIIMFGGVGVEFRALCLTGRHFTTWAITQPFWL